MKCNIVKLFSELKRFDRKHMQMLCIFLSVIVLYGMHTSMSVAIVAMTVGESAQIKTKTLDWDSTETSLILGSLCLGILITQMPCGYVASTYSAKKFLCFGLLTSGCLHILTPAIAEVSWLALVIFRVVEGLFQGCITPCIHDLLGKWMSFSSRARRGPLIFSGSQIGIVLSMSLSGLLARSNWGWQSIFYVFGTVSILWGIILYFIVLEFSKYHFEIKTPEMRVQDIPWKGILSSKPVWALIIASCGQSWNFFLFLTALPAYLKGIFDFDIQQIGNFSALPYSIMWILSLLVWWLSNYVFQNRFSKTVIRKTNNTIAMCGPALAMIILDIIETSNEIVVITMLVTVIALNAGVNCGYQANHLDLTQNFDAVIISLSSTIGNVFSLFAPIIRGFVVTDTSNTKQWQIIFYITASINFLANLVFVLFAEFETQLWTDFDFSSSRYGDQACRISTITAAYGTTLKRINTKIEVDINTDSEQNTKYDEELEKL